MRQLQKIELSYNSDRPGDLPDVTFYWTDTGEEPFGSSEYEGDTLELMRDVEGSIDNLNRYLELRWYTELRSREQPNDNS